MAYQYCLFKTVWIHDSFCSPFFQYFHIFAQLLIHTFFNVVHNNTYGNLLLNVHAQYIQMYSHLFVPWNSNEDGAKQFTISTALVKCHFTFHNSFRYILNAWAHWWDTCFCKVITQPHLKLPTFYPALLMENRRQYGNGAWGTNVKERKIYMSISIRL